MDVTLSMINTLQEAQGVHRYLIFCPNHGHHGDPHTADHLSWTCKTIKFIRMNIFCHEQMKLIQEYSELRTIQIPNKKKKTHFVVPIRYAKQ